MSWLLRILGVALAVVLALPLVALILGTSRDALGQTLVDGQVWRALAVSMGCAVCATGSAVLLGVPAGYLLAQRRMPLRRLLGAVVDVPLIVPHPIVGLGLLLAFGQRSLLGAALHDTLGVDVASAAPGIVVAMVVVSAPFVVKAARDGFAALPPDYAHTARTLGASEARIFFTVLWPMVRRPVASGALLAWARALSEFGSVVVLAYYPVTAPVLIWDRFTTRGLEAAVAPALLLCALCGAVFYWLQPAVRHD